MVCGARHPLRMAVKSALAGDFSPGTAAAARIGPMIAVAAKNSAPAAKTIV